MKPIPEWRQAWRFWSVRVSLLAIAFGALSADTQAQVLDLFGIAPSRVPAIIGLLGLVRVIAQPKLKRTDEQA